MVKLSELQIKELIVMDDGTRLGHIIDLEIDGRTGRIIAIIAEAKGKNRVCLLNRASFLSPGKKLFGLGKMLF